MYDIFTLSLNLILAILRLTGTIHGKRLGKAGELALKFMIDSFIY